MERNYCSVSFPIPRQPTTKFLKNFSALNIIALQVIENMEARSHHSKISKRDSVQSFSLLCTRILFYKEPSSRPSSKDPHFWTPLYQILALKAPYYLKTSHCTYSAMKVVQTQGNINFLTFTCNFAGTQNQEH